MFNLFKQTDISMYYEKYKTIRNKVNKMIKADKAKETLKLVTNFKESKKAFYGYVRSKQVVRTKIQQLRKRDDTMTQDDTEAAEELLNFFQSVFVDEGKGAVPTFQRHPEGTPVTDIGYLEITQEDVEKKLLNLRDDKAPGPDGLHPKALKELASVLGVPLAILFNKSLQEGVLPEDWKCANVISVFKKGLKTEAGNYRPVSLTSVPCKVMESVLRDKMLKHLDANDLLSHNQHGFTRKRSCLTNLLETLEEWTQALDEGYGVDAIFLDYQKAFDTVPHQRLINKLKGYGIGGLLLKWIHDFLTNRKMRVVLNGHKTDWAAVLSGVPQGSVLGPLLFFIYVNEIPDIIESSVKMFADDTKLWRTIQSEEDEQILQHDLDRLEDWSKEWLLKFNASKCKVMQIGRKKTVNYQLRDGMDSVNLEETEMEKDLGVWISKDLKWSHQCRNLQARQWQFLAW